MADVNQDANFLGKHIMKQHQGQRLIVGMNLCLTE